MAVLEKLKSLAREKNMIIVIVLVRLPAEFLEAVTSVSLMVTGRLIFHGPAHGRKVRTFVANFRPP